MRWESLFADLESQLESKLAEDLREEIAESTRVEKARQKFTEKLVGYRGSLVTLQLPAARELKGNLGPVGSDYLCLEDSSTRWLIRRAAVQAVVLPQRQIAQPRMMARTRLGAVIRALVRDRQPVQIFGMDSSSLGEGTLEQAAEDFLVLGIHPRDEYARARSVQRRVMIPYEAVAWIATQSAD